MEGACKLRSNLITRLEMSSVVLYGSFIVYSLWKLGRTQYSAIRVHGRSKQKTYLVIVITLVIFI